MEPPTTSDFPIPGPVDPHLHARIVNPSTRPLDPFPDRAVDKAVYNHSVLSKTPSLLLAYAARGPPELSQANQEHASFGSIVNARYRNETMQMPSHFPILKQHITEVLAMIAAPIFETQEYVDALGVQPQGAPVAAESSSE